MRRAWPPAWTSVPEQANPRRCQGYSALTTTSTAPVAYRTPSAIWPGSGVVHFDTTLPEPPVATAETRNSLPRRMFGFCRTQSKRIGDPKIAGDLPHIRLTSSITPLTLSIRPLPAENDQRSLENPGQRGWGPMRVGPSSRIPICERGELEFLTLPVIVSGDNLLVVVRPCH
jgi:hypothetical protein